MVATGARTGGQGFKTQPHSMPDHFPSISLFHGAGSWRARQDKPQLPEPHWPQQGQDAVFC